MVFSRDGKYLLIVGGIPDFKISIFDLENKRMLKLEDSKLPFEIASYKRTKFNPQNSSEFCILGKDVIYFYKIHTAFEYIDENNIGDSERLSSIEYRNENPELTYGNFIWDQYKRIHVCTDFPQILMIDS